MQRLLMAAVVLLAWLPGAAIAQPASAQPHVVTNPEWLRKPSGADVARVYPKQAIAVNAGGTATVSCRTTAAGALENCRLVTENPTGLGFGDAALSMTPLFRMAPTIEGRSVEGGTIQIPVIFRLAESRKIGVITNPPWASAPTVNDVASAYPAKATAIDRGTALVRCEFTRAGTPENCKLLSETPRGRGFGEAALSLTSKFTLSVDPLDTSFVSFINADIPFTFQNPARPSASNPQPQWTRTLTAAGANKLFPSAARTAGVTTGLGRVSCTGSNTGLLRDCRIMSEDPPGMGFGAAALAASAEMAMNPWSAGGESMDGRQVTLPIRFRIETPAAPAAAP